MEVASAAVGGTSGARASVVAGRTGVVVLLDALGTHGQRTEADWVRLVNVRMDSFRRAAQIQPTNVFDGSAKKDVTPPAPTFSIRPTVAGFADSLLIMLEPSDGSVDPTLVLHVVTHILSFFFVECLDQSDLLRGAVSYGQYYEGGGLFLGPAVEDVADYYDIADWAGLVLTPKTGDLWESGTAVGQEGVLRRTFGWSRTTVPVSPTALKRKSERISRGPLPSWGLSWAHQLPIRQLTTNAIPLYEPRRADVAAAFRPGPEGSRWVEKRDNTLRFFDERWDVAYPANIAFDVMTPGGPGRPSGPAAWLKNKASRTNGE